MQPLIVMNPFVDPTIEEDAVVVDIDVNELTEIATEDTIEPIPRKRAKTWTPHQGVTTTEPIVGVMRGSKRSTTNS